MRVFLFIFIIGVYALFIVPFTSYLSNRPVAVKLGYFPAAEILRPCVADQRLAVAQYAVVRVLFYYGTLVEKLKHQITIPPEYPNMYRTLETAIKLDPYNMDAYYFAQAAFTWDVGKIIEVNEMLDYGMRYRTWDYQLPFYAAFNCSYFLHDFKSSARYMQKAAELSHNPLLTNLTARYLYESGQTELGIKFLDFMEKDTWNSSVKRLYELRKRALQAVILLEKGIADYTAKTGKQLHSLQELVASGIIQDIPKDPYGGEFYLDAKGSVRSTSKFALMGKE